MRGETTRVNTQKKFENKLKENFTLGSTTQEGFLGKLAKNNLDFMMMYVM